jgi:hypothetical protein
MIHLNSNQLDTCTITADSNHQTIQLMVVLYLNFFFGFGVCVVGWGWGLLSSLKMHANLDRKSTQQFRQLPVASTPRVYLEIPKVR